MIKINLLPREERRRRAPVNTTIILAIVAAAIGFLAMGGAAGQDSKKEQLMGEAWAEWRAHTAYVPFARGFANPGMFALVGGTILFFAATWAHQPAGFWRWFG